MSDARKQLTDQEQQVAVLIGDGLTDKQIAAAMRLSRGRIRQLFYAIISKWKLRRDRNQRAQIAKRVGESESRRIAS